MDKDLVPNSMKDLCVLKVAFDFNQIELVQNTLFVQDFFSDSFFLYFLNHPKFLDEIHQYSNDLVLTKTDIIYEMNFDALVHPEN